MLRIDVLPCASRGGGSRSETKGSSDLNQSLCVLLARMTPPPFGHHPYWRKGGRKPYASRASRSARFFNASPFALNPASTLSPNFQRTNTDSGPFRRSYVW